MFIDKLQKLCNERGISVYKATTEIGLNRSAVAKWKTGATPNGETLRKFAQFFDVDIDYLLGETSDHKSEDAELEELLEQLKTRPDMRLLFNLASNATPEDVMKAVKIIEALKEGLRMYFVRLIPMPPSVEGAVLPNDDGTYDIYINANLPVGRQAAVLAHEVAHIKKDHLYDERPVWANEAEAV